MRAQEFVNEKWSRKYKRSIDCSNPRGFSQRAHCQGRKKHQEDINEDDLEEQLYFKGSPCTVDCSGHMAGYEWWQRKRRVPNSWSPSFNNGATLASQGK
jgi:hypothetical protein